jgi:hypothetical protein
VAPFDYIEPFVPRDGGGGGETVVEEGFYGSCFWDGGVFGDEADESTWREGGQLRHVIISKKMNVTKSLGSTTELCDVPLTLVYKSRLLLSFLIQSKEKTKKKNRENILLTSPIPGPPNTLINSLDDPPLSLIGIILSSHQQIFFSVIPFSKSNHCIKLTDENSLAQ